ncbi:putative methionine--tRNA ligase [Sesbania bispinosa]|nr:putative methionine--tRNA ligase [Sesbania bispinosa]
MEAGGRPGTPEVKEDHDIIDSHRILDGGSRSLKDRLGEMACNNALELAEKKAQRESQEGGNRQGCANPGCEGRLLVPPKVSPTSLKLRTPEEDAALKLLSQQEQRVFTPALRLLI